MRNSILALCLLLAYNINAQLVSVKNDFVTTKLILPAAIQTMNTGSFYKVVYPERVIELNRREILFGTSIYIRTDAKPAKKNDTADFIFHIVTPGIKNIQMLDVVQSSSYSTSGFAIPFQYKFPAKVEVRNREGTLIKTLIISDEEQIFTENFHQNFLAPVKDFKEYSSTVPFQTTEAAYNAERQNDGAIKLKLERIAWQKIFEKIEDALNVGFGEYKIPNAAIALYNIGKSDVKNFSELHEEIEKQKDAIDKLGSKTEKASAMQAMMKNLNYYENYLTTTKDIDRNIKKMIYYNAALCALFNNQVGKAKELYDLYQQNNPSKFPEYYINFPTYYDVISFHAELSAKDDTIKVTRSL